MNERLSVILTVLCLMLIGAMSRPLAEHNNLSDVQANAHAVQVCFVSS